VNHSGSLIKSMSRIKSKRTASDSTGFQELVRVVSVESMPKADPLRMIRKGTPQRLEGRGEKLRHPSPLPRSAPHPVSAVYTVFDDTSKNAENGDLYEDSVFVFSPRLQVNRSHTHLLLNTHPRPIDSASVLGGIQVTQPKRQPCHHEANRCSRQQRGNQQTPSHANLCHLANADVKERRGNKQR